MRHQGTVESLVFGKQSINLPPTKHPRHQETFENLISGKPNNRNNLYAAHESQTKTVYAAFCDVLEAHNTTCDHVIVFNERKMTRQEQLL